MVLDDDPLAVKHYILDSNLSRINQWHEHFNKGIQKTTRRLFIINNGFRRLFLVVMVPWTYIQAVALDKIHSKTLWQNAVEKEMADLIHHEWFIKPNDKPTDGYKYAPLNLIFQVKPDLARKARLVIMGNIVDPRGLATCATVVKGISVRLLSLIAHRYDLTESHHNIGLCN